MLCVPFTNYLQNFSSKVHFVAAVYTKLRIIHMDGYFYSEIFHICGVSVRDTRHVYKHRELSLYLEPVATRGATTSRGFLSHMLSL